MSWTTVTKRKERKKKKQLYFFFKNKEPECIWISLGLLTGLTETQQNIGTQTWESGYRYCSKLYFESLVKTALINHLSHHYFLSIFTLKNYDQVLKVAKNFWNLSNQSFSTFLIPLSAKGLFIICHACHTECLDEAVSVFDHQ